MSTNTITSIDSGADPAVIYDSDDMTISAFFNPNDILGQALWTLLMLSLLTAPMGCFIAWRRLSYFGATLAHSALLGAILGLLTGIGVVAGVIGFTALLAIGLSFWLNHRQLASDTVLGMIAHFVLAIGVIAVSLMDELRVDLMTYLLGDVLAISTPVLNSVVVFSIVGVLCIIYCFKGFVNLSVQADIAKVEGFSIQWLELFFMLALSLTISLGILSIGILLIIAMLIIPAATARVLARSIIQMVVMAWIFTVISILFGLLLAYVLDFPAGPTVVALQGILFVVINVMYYALKRL